MAKRVPYPQNVPVALAILEAPSLVLEWCNEYMYAMAARFTDQEIIGHPIGQFLPIERVPEIEMGFNYAADTGEPAFLEGEVVGPAGRMTLHASIHRIPGGKLLVTAWHPIPEPLGPSDEPVGTLHPTAVYTGEPTPESEEPDAERPSD
jgi:hypothetical protein